MSLARSGFEDLANAAVLIADGVRAERAGAMDRALDAFRTVRETERDPDLLAQALTHEADVLRGTCQWEEAMACARQAQGIAWDADLADRYLEALNAEANILTARGRFDEARPLLERVASGSPNPRLRGIALQNLGTIWAQSGQHRAAERSFAESLGNFHKAGYDRGECIALNNLGRLAMDCGDAERARPLLERAIDIARALEDHEMAALAGLNLGWLLCQAGQAEPAQDHAMAALGYFAGCGNRWREVECFRLMGDINTRCEDFPNAMRCYELALMFAQQIDCMPEIRAIQDRLSELSRHPPPRPSPPAGTDTIGGTESVAPLS